MLSSAFDSGSGRRVFPALSIHSCDEDGIETLQLQVMLRGTSDLPKDTVPLGTICRKVCYQFKVTRMLAVGMALAGSCSVMTRNGLSADQPLFGRKLALH